MSKNILVVQSCTNQPIYEISLEVIEKEIRNGNNVTILSCNGVLPTCLVNPYHHKSICSECLYRQKHGLRLLSKKINQVQLNITKTIETLNLSCNLDDLLKVQIDSVKLGKAFAAFYTCTHFSSYGINLNKAFLSQIYSQYYIWFQNFLTIANSFDEFYIHNGRFPIDKAIIDFCITNSKTFFCYDTADVKNRYVLPKNVPIHDISYIKKQMQLLWSKANSEDKELIGNSFFKNRRYHIQNDSHSFTKHQVLNALPQDLDNRKELITIFNSTAEEVFTVDGFEYNLFNNEKEGLELILQHYQNDNTKQFIIRVHPHLSNCDNYQTQYLYELPKKYLNLLLIRPEEKIEIGRAHV